MRGAGRIAPLVHRPRVWKYRALSTCRNVSGRPVLIQPVLFVGSGRIVIGESVEFGWQRSAAFFSGYSHIEAATADAWIEFGDGAQVNNNAFIKSEGPGIKIGPDALIGSFVEIFDSDFHDLHPQRRRRGVAAKGEVDVGANVFLGDGVKILKGVSIGRDSVIGAGSVVTADIPAGVVAAGNPTRVVRTLEEMPPRPTARDALAGIGER